MSKVIIGPWKNSNINYQILSQIHAVDILNTLIDLYNYNIKTAAFHPDQIYRLKNAHALIKMVIGE